MFTACLTSNHSKMYIKLYMANESSTSQTINIELSCKLSISLGKANDQVSTSNCRTSRKRHKILCVLLRRPKKAKISWNTITLLTTTKLSLNCEQTIFSRCCTKATWEKNVFVRRQMESKHLAAKLREPVAAEWRTNHGMTRARRTSPENTRRRQERDKPQARHRKSQQQNKFHK